MCEQNALSKLYGNLLQTSSLWHRDALVNGRVTRSFGRICLRARPQDDIVSFAGGFAPCTPIRNCEHSCLTIIVQFDILFFHKQVCQQSALRPTGAAPFGRGVTERVLAFGKLQLRLVGLRLHFPSENCRSCTSLHSGSIDSVQNVEASFAILKRGNEG